MSRNRILGSPYTQIVITGPVTTDPEIDAYLVDAVPLTITLDPNAFNGDQVLIQDITNDAAATRSRSWRARGRRSSTASARACSSPSTAAASSSRSTRKKAVGFPQGTVGGRRHDRSHGRHRGGPAGATGADRPGPRASEPRGPRVRPACRGATGATGVGTTGPRVRLDLPVARREPQWWGPAGATGAGTAGATGATGAASTSGLLATDSANVRWA